MENPAMRANHPLATYGGIYVIVRNAQKKQSMMMIFYQEEGRKNPPNRSSKKDMEQVIQK